MDDQDLKARAAQVEALVGEIESFKEPEARAKTTELLQALLQLYGEGLARMLGIVAERDQAVLDLLVRDELIAHLLLLHGLHPIPLEARVAAALEHVHSYLQAHGGHVELLSVERAVVRLRLHGSSRGCPSSAMTLRLTIEEAIREAAPELETIEMDELPKDEPMPNLIPLSSLSRKAEAGAA
jgi:Fe-S cluster biogenesis protein NfuA